MVNPLELRLGNYVLYNGQIAVVSGINSPAPRKDKNFDGKYVIELVLDGLIDCTLEDLEPIPLNGVLLERFGCSKNYHELAEFVYVSDIATYYISGWQDVWTIGVDYTTTTEDGLAFFAHDIQYVHHFQNLMYTLIGEELSYGTRTKR